MEKGFENKKYFSQAEVDKMIKEERHLGREDLEYYLAFLELNKEDLENKNILDVGSSTGKIVEEINELNSKAFGVDPIYAQESGREILKNKNKAIAGMAGNGNNLPFKTETFDIIINNFSTFNYAKNENVVNKNFEEQLRLLKEGGSLYVFPLKWSFKLREYVVDLEDNFIEEKEVIIDSFLKKIKELKQREDLEISFGEPNYKKLVEKIQIPLHEPEKIYYLKIKKNPVS